MKRILAILSLAAASSATAATVLNYPDFSSVAGLQLNGSAAQAGNVLRITPATTNQSGSAFSTSAVTLTSQVSFSTYFSFQLSNSGGISDEDGVGADGLVFAVQTVSNTAGGAGGGMGYQGLINSLGIEFDTYNNGLGLGDPSGNHVAIDINGNLGAPLASAIVAPRLNNGSIWYAWVDYDGPSDSLEVRLSTTNSRPALPTVAASVDLTTVLGSTNAYVGFTAGTGSAYNNHDVLSWEFRDDFAPISTPDGGSTLAILGMGLSSLVVVRRMASRRKAKA